ncbi:uncharacterized protein TRIVIDRAFT_217263 [Trichoderma virens Gv29-8]|uniref:Uncharacterized protein n=1 Tax=Hypocrea virens (strain Gv29-8 / FGSC 10586) TaxID=413071 RepID=G9NCV9_HYPVG|nr:uncharacterized protein TRIVIDRAFT_217263 [Trichoderma virens Gv29-8]EHK15531.1 hypothetical protein TRIVIDRAFT_217263 [Trichoderma virens Gv29-8]
MAKPGLLYRSHQDSYHRYSTCTFHGASLPCRHLAPTRYYASYCISGPSMCNMCTYRGMAERDFCPKRRCRGHPGPAASSRVSDDISGILGCFYWAPGLHDALGGLLA